MTASARRPGRPRLPIADRRKQGMEPRTLCVATALTPVEVDALDRQAGGAGETRSEYIRKAVLDRINRSKGAT